MEKRKVILDVDTGSDDAIAIMCAVLSPEKIDLLGIVSVNGNRPLHNTTENTLRVVDLLHANVPVVMGAAEKLVAGLDARRALVNFNIQKVTDDEGNEIAYHQEYLDTLAPSVSKPVDKHFIQWYIDTLKAAGRVTLAPVGPLTNIALLLRCAPQVKQYIEEIVIMGGGFAERNCTPTAEFNIWSDPEAAQIVMTSGCKITLVTLDATHRANLEPQHVVKLRAMGTKAAAFAADMVDERLLAYNTMQPLHRPDIAPIHDALCIAYLLEPGVIKTRPMRVDVDCGGGLSDGQTICDVRRAPNCSVAVDTDEQLFADMMMDIIARARD